MQVTEVGIAFVKPKGGLVVVNIVLDEQVYLSGIACDQGRPFVKPEENFEQS